MLRRASSSQWRPWPAAPHPAVRPVPSATSLQLRTARRERITGSCCSRRPGCPQRWPRGPRPARRRRRDCRRLAQRFGAAPLDMGDLSGMPHDCQHCACTHRPCSKRIGQCLLCKTLCLSESSYRHRVLHSGGGHVGDGRHAKHGPLDLHPIRHPKLVHKPPHAFFVG